MGGNNANFNATTRSFTQSMSPMVMSAVGTTTYHDLPQSGYLGAIDLIFNITLTTAGSSSLTLPVYPLAGLGFIKNIKLRTNEGADVWNTSGQGAYLYERTLRGSFDPLVAPLGTSPVVAIDGSPYRKPVATMGASATLNVRIPIRLQLSWGEMLMAGLILLQNPGVRFTLSIDWGQVTDLSAATTGTVTIAASVTPHLEQYLVPQEDSNQPDLSLAKTVLEDIRSVPAQSGTFSYEPPRGNTYTRLIQEWIDGTTPSPFGFTGDGLSTAKIDSTGVVYSQTQNINSDPIANKLFTQRRLFNQDFPQGVIVHEYSLGNGVPEFPNGRDNIDTSEITDFNINSVITGTPGAGSYVRTVKEQLVVVQA